MTDKVPVRSVGHQAEQGEFFFLEPRTERFVRGATKKLYSGGSCCLLLFLIPFVLGGVLLLGMWLRVWVRTIALSIDSAETWGTYVSKYEDDSGDDTSYLVTYRFVVDDRVYVVEESVKEATYTSADNGESLPVRYVVHDPDIATIEPISFVGPLLLTAFCVVWCGLVFGAFFFNLYILLKWRRLARDGELTEGEIIHCSGEKDSDGDYHLKAEVRFRSPQTGEWLQGTYSPKRNDLKGKSLPGPGTRVHVIYLDDKTYEAL